MISDRSRARPAQALLAVLVMSATFAWSHVADAGERTRDVTGGTGVVTSGASSPLGSPVPSNWLAAFNHYRELAGLPPVTESSELDEGVTWSEGGRLHSKWMVKNQIIDHFEDPGSPYYTVPGDLAGQNGNIMISGDYAHTDRAAIEGWITAPFHAIGMLDPLLATTGYGHYRERRTGFQFGATVDVIRGRDATPGPELYPVMFPGAGATVYLDRYPGGEMPDPLDAPGCEAFVEPTGLPIYLMLQAEEELQSTTFTRGTTNLDHCAYDDDGYTGSPPGGDVMAARNAIFLIPQKPLGSEKTYDVSITTDQDTYSWSFQTGDVKPPRSKILKPAANEIYDRDKLRKMKGTASTESERVNVALAGVTDVSTWTCRYLKGNGTFGGERSCFDQLWLKANGTADWSRAFGTKLPVSGTNKKFKQYMAFSQAIDEVGNVQRDPDIKGDGNAFLVTP